MARNLAHELMNKGNSRERQLGRMLSRGRVSHVPGDLLKAIELTDQILKDMGGGAAGAMAGADVYTPTPNNPPPRRRKSRLESNDK